MEHTQNDVLRATTEHYLSTIDPANPPEPSKIEAELLEMIQSEFEAENKILVKGVPKWKAPFVLDEELVATILVRLHNVKIIDLTYGKLESNTCPVIGVYQKEGPNAGIYDTSEVALKSLARQYNRGMTKKQFEEIKSILNEYAETIVPCMEQNLVAVNNGIFDFDTKQLLPFSPDKVFISKSKVDYNPNAVNVTIHNPDDNTDWDVESWMDEISDDPEITNLLWEILSAIVRPNVPWDKTVFFYSEIGNNGKGTLCRLMRNLCGANSYASLKISDFSKDFFLTDLIGKSAVITDENDVGAYIDKAADFKSAATGDVIMVNIKFKDPIKIQFRGLIVQCLNDLPKVKDKSDAFWRRILMVPFYKCFTGVERKYIKGDYLQRKDVLEYVLYRVLHMNHYTLSVPKASESVLAEYKDINDPVRQFIEEIVPRLAWDLVPYGFLYDLYKAWYQRNMPGGSVSGKINFLKDFRKLMKGNADWDCSNPKKNHRVGTKLDKPEMLIDEYSLTPWMNKRYMSHSDRILMCIPDNLPAFTTGMVRVMAGAGAVDDDDEDEDEDEDEDNNADGNGPEPA